MSYRVTVEIVCDAKGCGELLREQRVNRGGLTKTWAGYLAVEEHGWDIGGRATSHDPIRAFCPAHRRK
jgi:hypothetical protein